MGIADRAMDALRPTNAIEPAPATPAPAAPGYWFSSTAVHPARHFDRAADAAAAFSEAPVQAQPVVRAALPDGSARYVATTLRIDRRAGVPGFEKSVGKVDKEFAAAYEAVRQATRVQVQAAPGHAPEEGKRPAYTTEPASVAKNYYVEEKDGERRYFDDYKRKALAMRATDTSISTKREDLNTIRAMIELAQARGWHSVEIRGTAEFKREAWIEAMARGLDGRGYAPSDLDRQEADRRRAERGPANEVRAQPMAAQATKPQGPRAAPQDAPAAAAVARELANEPRAQTGAAQAPKPQGPRAASRDAPATAAAERDPVNEPRVQTAAAQATKPQDVRTASKDAPAAAAERGQSSPSLADNRKAVHDAQRELSADGRLVLAALSEKIDREMNRHNLEAKANMKAFVAGELVKKERAEGPIVLSAGQKRAAAAPEPTQAAPKPDAAAVPRRREPEAPRRTLSR